MAEARVSTPMVVDGDTLTLDGERVRLWGVDAPERDQTCERATEAFVDAHGFGVKRLGLRPWPLTPRRSPARGGRSLRGGACRGEGGPMSLLIVAKGKGRGAGSAPIGSAGQGRRHVVPTCVESSFRQRRLGQG